MNPNSQQTDAVPPFAPPPGYPAHLDWNHAEFYPVRCPRCGWIGMSDETEGGEQIADTGDYSQIVCPKCIEAHGKGHMHDDAEWVPVEDLPKPDNSGFIGESAVYPLNGDKKRREDGR